MEIEAIEARVVFQGTDNTVYVGPDRRVKRKEGEEGEGREGGGDTGGGVRKGRGYQHGSGDELTHAVLQRSSTTSDVSVSWATSSSGEQ